MLTSKFELVKDELHRMYLEAEQKKESEEKNRKEAMRIRQNKM